MINGVVSAFSLIKIDSEYGCFFKPVQESQLKWDREKYYDFVVVVVQKKEKKRGKVVVGLILFPFF